MNWFVINENEHLGPFEEEVLKQLFGAGDLKPETLFWREGMPEPKAFREIFLEEPLQDPLREQDQGELPPELPADALQVNKKESSNTELLEREQATQSKPKFKPKPKVGPSDLKPERLKRVEPKREEAKHEIAVAKKVDVEIGERQLENEEKNFDLLYKLKFGASFILVLLILIPGWMYYTTHFTNFSRPAKMGLKDYERLKKASSFRGDKNAYAFSLAQDKNTLWMATNVPYTGPVVLKLISAPDKILANDPVVITSKGFLEGRLAEFKSFEFEKGQNIIDGWYEVELITPARLDVPIAAKYFSSRKRQFRYIDQILLTNMDRQDFSKALKDFSMKKERNGSAFWEELKQKYETIKAMAERIKKSLNKVFQGNGRDWSQRVDLFEQEYTQKYGSFFTNFVIQNEKSYNELKEKDFQDKMEVIANYTRLSRLAKSVGGQTMDALKDMRSLKSPLNEKARKNLKQEVNKRFKELEDSVDQKLSILESK